MKPASLKVVGKTYAVLFLDEVDAEDNNGEHDLQKQEIRVKNGIHPELVRDVMLHEVLHAIDEQLDLRLKHKQFSLIYKVRWRLHKQLPSVKPIAVWVKLKLMPRA